MAYNKCASETNERSTVRLQSISRAGSFTRWSPAPFTAYFPVNYDNGISHEFIRPVGQG